MVASLNHLEKRNEFHFGALRAVPGDEMSVSR
jgi:hypothetical protein